MSPHKSHILDLFNITEDQYDLIFTHQLILEQMTMLWNIELGALKQRKSHSSITELEILAIDNRINEIEQNQLMHLLKYKN